MERLQSLPVEEKQHPTVSAAGDAWIICRSKSYSGHIYYFNTLTGHAVWNLSSNEIEKAKQKTKMLESMGESRVEGCPEPSEPPSDPLCGTTQILKNLRTKLISERHIEPTIAVPQRPQRSNVEPTLIPNIWTGSDTENTSNLFSSTVGRTIIIPNTTIPLSNRFKYNRNLTSEDIKPMPLNRFSPERPSNSLGNIHTFDLRHVLHSKKRLQYERNSTFKDFDEDNNGRNMTNEVAKEEIEDNVLDTKSLKTLVFNDPSPNIWFIVTDSNIFLYNLMFLKTLLQSDKDLRLMISQHVWSEVEDATRSGAKQVVARAHSALAFISLHIDEGRAFIDEESFQDTINVDILTCCFNVVKEGYHVILLTNDVNLLNYSHTTSVPTFTIGQVKAILQGNSNDGTQSLVFHKDVKITIPNDVSPTETKSQNFNEYITNGPVILEHDNKEIKTIIRKPCKAMCTQTPLIKMVEIGIQTDLVELAQPQIKHTVHRLTQTELETIPENIEDSAAKKSEEIRLKRSGSNPVPSADDNQVFKKTFKWRRKRILSNTRIEEISENSDKITTNLQTPAKANKPDKSDDKIECVGNNLDWDYSNSSCVAETKSIKDVNVGKFKSDAVTENLDRKHLSSKKQHSPDESMNHVMFEVTDKVMEEYLTTRCDEWVSRFVQIMEEVLTQILQNVKSVSDGLPPPWNLYEATVCIKKSFSSSNDINDAAIKLSGVLLKISDERGRINVNLKPVEYMEMYSYGVYLVDTLQACIANSEDVQYAAESLSKLLNDIQHPTSEVQNDSFPDVIDPSIAIAETSSLSEDEETVISKHNSMKSNTMSHESKSPKKTNRKPDIESEFFTSLSLKKNLDGEIENSTELQPNCDLLPKELPNTDPNDPVEIKIDTAPKIVRNFVLFDEYEKRINKYGARVFLEELDCADDRFIDYHSVQDKSEKSFTNAPSTVFDNLKRADNKDYECSNDDELDYNEIYDDKEDVQIDCREKDVPPEIDETFCDSNDYIQTKIADNARDKNNNFRSFVVYLLKEIQQVFAAVRLFCKEAYKDISAAETMSCKRKLEIQDKAERTYLYIENLCKSLSSITARDKNINGDKFRSFLFQDGLEYTPPTDEEYDNYRTIISNSLDTAQDFLEPIRIIKAITK